MQKKKITKILKKINNLHKSIKDGDEVSRIEEDLLISYVQKLYEAVIDNDSSSEENIMDNNVPLFKKDKIIEKPDFLDSEGIIHAYEVQKHMLEPEKLEKPEHTNIESEIVVESEDNSNDEDTDSDELQKKSIPEEMKILFELIDTNELSSKLAFAPIKSIKEKMGLNEQLLTIAELFGKDKEAYDKAITQLDSYSDFEEAKEYMAVELVEKYSWLDEYKFKKAIRFIQLVQRRYL